MTEPCEPCQRAAAAGANPRHVVDFVGECVSCAARAIVALGFAERPDCSMRTFGEHLEQGRSEIERWRKVFRQHQASKAGQKE